MPHFGDLHEAVSGMRKAKTEGIETESRWDSVHVDGMKMKMEVRDDFVERLWHQQPLPLEVMERHDLEACGTSRVGRVGHV